MIEKKNILGVGITNATKEEVLEYIIKSLENFKKKYFIVTPNPEFLVLASKNFTFKNILNKAALALTDGIGILIAGKILGKELKERFTGVELLESLCLAVAKKPITVGFLGGREGVAEKTAECLRKKYPGLKVAFAQEEWPKDHFGRQKGISRGPVARFPPAHLRQDYGGQASVSAALPLEAYKRSGVGSPSSRTTPRQFMIPPIDILFVAFGAPKQEIWISENLDKIPVKIAIGIGGAFDYISGQVPRVPLFIRKIGFEWCFRLLIQPWRIKRQLALLEFMWLMLREKMKLPTASLRP